MKLPDIKPCPFCGNAVAIGVYSSHELDELIYDDIVYDTTPSYAVVCSVNETSPVPTPNWRSGCGGSSGYSPTPEEAIAKWNRRTK